MSLINKMLQDLDSRGTGPAGSLAGSVKLAPHAATHFSWPLVAGVVAAVAISVAGGTFFWRYYKAQQALPSPARALQVQAPQAKALPMVDATGSPIVPAVVAAASVTAQAQKALETSAKEAAQAANAQAGAAPAASAPVVLAQAASPAVASVPAASAAAASVEAELPHAAVPASAKAPVAKARPVLAKATTKRETAAKKADKPAPSAQAVELTSAQRAEADYRRAMQVLQDGRNGEAMAALEQALRTEPRHEAARQTLVGLLIEARRSEEALRHLQLGLTLDPRQPSMAMLLARLQIERGATGIETLMRTLPYATGNGEYHAFLAAALARDARHREAAEQYKLALRGIPNNGQWLLGLAISLQNEKRTAEALEAFKQAKATNLSAEQAAFVERRISALAR
jgi:MSHA biogenesis protein MshN